jgi:hypothetical protein
MDVQLQQRVITELLDEVKELEAENKALRNSTDFSDGELCLDEVAHLKFPAEALSNLLGKEKSSSEEWLKAAEGAPLAEIRLMRVVNQSFVSSNGKLYYVMKLMYNSAAQKIITTFCALKKMTPGDRRFYDAYLMDKIPFLIVVALVNANIDFKEDFAGAYPIGYLPEHEVDNITCVRMSKAGKIVYDRLSVAFENAGSSKKPFKFDIANGTSIRTGILKPGGANDVVEPWVLGWANQDPALIAAGMKLVKVEDGITAVSLETGEQLDDAQQKLMSWSAQNPDSLGKTDLAFSEHSENKAVVTVSRTSTDAMPANRMILQWMSTLQPLKQYDVRFLDREDAIIFPSKNYGAVVDTLEKEFAEHLVISFDPDTNDTAARCELNLYLQL